METLAAQHVPSTASPITRARAANPLHSGAPDAFPILSPWVRGWLIAPLRPRAALGLEAEHSRSAAPGCPAGYEEVIQIPKGSVHIDIRELNLSINYLGETGLGRLKSQPGPAVCLGLTGSGKGPARRASHPG